MKDSWVQIRTGRDHSPITLVGRIDLIWENYLNVLQITLECA